MDLLFELVAVEIEAQLSGVTIQEWDIVGRSLKALVFEFSLLDKQMAPYIQYLQKDPEMVRDGGLDSDELRMLESHIASIADRLGIQVERTGEEKSFLKPIKHRWFS